ncbi:ABC transporter ATP-binding protein [Afifella sp. IM 167]|uniref:ABC transporter ATP-binding protein n=1 Tax=Afifella sp. IM 167 TaxID=2033586 RepID=UPI001CC94201|nr:ABC transporter ATP-binding protein [Afifella sp. IM 167]
MQDRDHRQPKLELRGVSKRYGDFAALKRTDLSVSAGEFVTLLGPSGSGKTTLLTIVAGLSASNTGEIWIDGAEATNQPVHKRDIGMVFQNYALFPHLSVFENVAFPLRMRRTPESEIKRKVNRMLEVVHLPHVGDRLTRELSGGQQQRIALARCAVYEPSIILMDEPLGALDKKLRDQMQVEIKRLHTELGATILYVTHDQEEAMAMSDRICLMNRGGIEQLGTPQELYFRPTSKFAADFLGTSNLFGAKVEGVGETIDLSTGFHASISALRGADVGPGEEVDVMVRPEHLRLLKDGETADNVVPATFEGTMITGSVTRHWARLDDGTTIVALSLTTGPTLSFQPGEAVRFGWPKDGTVLIRPAREG